MSEADDRENRLIQDAYRLRNWYSAFGNPDPDVVSLFAEDYDFLKRRNKIIETDDGAFLDSEIPVKRVHRKRKPRKKRLPELFA